MSEVYIIAEAGVNHNGSLNLAKQLVDKAVEAQVDAVKFQTWDTNVLITPDAKQAGYQVKNTGIVESQYSMLKKLELSYDDFRELKVYCDTCGISFLSTADEEQSASFLRELQSTFKIGSGEVTNLPFLRHVGGLAEEIILSTGMANLGEIELAIEALLSGGISRDMITVLHATTEYPTSMENVNLRAMLSIAEAFKVKVGYSDHTQGIEVPIAAVALGARVIEKHFTLDRNMEGPDHKASLLPEELKDMVKAIRNIEKAMGDGIKKPSQNERLNKNVVRKSIVCLKAILKGEIFSTENITVKRAGDGMSPMRWDEIIGLVAERNYEENDLI